MLRIRLWRTGHRRRPLYRLVVTPRTAAPKGVYREAVGHYDPHTKSLTLKKERILYWLKSGAQPSDTLAKLLSKAGLKHPLIVVKKFPKKPRKAKVKKEEKAVPPKKPASPAGGPEVKEEVKTKEKEKSEEPEKIKPEEKPKEEKLEK